ncbi:MAG: hypothetical protein H6Q38_2854 [Chloroflexi bacterium]|jgi:hypothetical protein|nr:hypothetical protein [Chloroflexota bacterium]
MNFVENILGAMQVGGTLLLSPILRGWYNRWGATPEEVTKPLPGDELVPEPRLGYTHAITIEASPENIWPWLAQMGQGRGGLYSYDGLENLAGCNIHSVEHVLSEYQILQVGDLIRLGPQGYPCFAASSVDPGRTLVLISADPKTGQAVQPTAQIDKGYSIATWQFILQPLDENTTRLLVRQRLSYSSDLTWVWRLTEPVAFVMERKMMLGIRRRAEKNHVG